MTMERGNRRLQVLITLAVSTASITGGVGVSWTTPVIPKFYKNETGFHLTDNELSWMVAIKSIGYTAGSLLSRFTSDDYGRKATILGSMVPLAIGVVVQIFARGVWTICAAKFLWGLNIGVVGSVSTIYIAEIADKEIRGSLILGYRVMFSFGCLVTLIAGPLISYDALNCSMAVLPIGYFLACWFIPETPYFLLKVGKVDAARNTLMKITGIKDEMLLEERLNQMRAEVKKEMSRSGSIKEFLTGKQYRKAILISVGVKLTQLVTGLTAILQYLGPIVEGSNSGIELSTALIIFGVVRFVLGIVSSLLIDRLGRRPLLIYSFMGAAVCLAVIGGFFFFHDKQDPSVVNPYGFIPIVGVTLVFIIGSLGFESVAYMITSEIFPINVKSLAMASINILAGLISFTSLKSYQFIKDLGGFSTVFWVYGTSALLGAVFCAIFVPETKRKSLQQIQIQLQGKYYDTSQDDEKERPPEEIELNKKNNQA